jgi:hypothetical protein
MTNPVITSSAPVLLLLLVAMLAPLPVTPVSALHSYA